jgi:nucleotide-binding universal stress UspA family protein
VTLLQVLEAPPTNDFRPDPIESDIRRHEAQNVLKRLAEARYDDIETIDVELAEGQTVEEICRCTRERAAELIVLGTHGERGPGAYGIGSTARAVLDQAAGSILLVPIFTLSARMPRYRRVLVPLDGSPWSESVLPLAARLARAVDAELILAHIVPAPELTETDPLEVEDLELRERVVDRNERVARSYLDRVRGYVAEPSLKVRALTLRGDDVRSSLTTLIGSERVDLVVLSARGQGSNRVSDVPYGNVTAYLVTHLSVPMLIVRPAEPPKKIHIAAKREVVRPPARPGV